MNILPCMTTWYQLSFSSSAHSEQGDDSESEGFIMSSQLMNIKLKLEEKRRQIENDKWKKESQENRRRIQIRNAAFLKAVIKNTGIESVAGEINDTESNGSLSKPSGEELIIENSTPDPVTIDEMEKKKERILLLSLQRRQQQEELKIKKEIEFQLRKEKEQLKVELKQRKKEEDKQRRAEILEQYRMNKVVEETEREGTTLDKDLINPFKINHNQILSGPPRLRSKLQNGCIRPKTIRVDTPYATSTPSLAKKGSKKSLARGLSYNQGSLIYQCGDTNSDLGLTIPPRRTASLSGSGLIPIRCKFDDGTSESVGSYYNGPKLYKQPVIKTNRGIILNAVEYCVFPGVVNREAKKRVLDEINGSVASHFLVLFRDTGCKFRALYLYYPESNKVAKLYGTGPRIVTDHMFDKFYKYNSSCKCFSEVYTKHLTITIDAFTIHNSLWQNKNVNYANKKDMTPAV